MHDDTPLRAARDAYNRAIAARDPDAIAARLTDDYDLVTSRGATLRGRDAARANWRRRFADDPDVRYVRTPERFDQTGPDAAHERGSWHGRFTEDGVSRHAAGTYAAEWRRGADGEWRVSAERFELG